MPDPEKILIIGMGNVARMDDGAGVHVIKHLIESKMWIPENIELIEAGSAIHDLLPLMMGRKKVVIVDALRVEDVPGSVYRIPSGELKKNFWEILRISPELRDIIFQSYIISGDAEVDFIGIVPADLYTCSLELSCSVKEKIDCAAIEALRAATII